MSHQPRVRQRYTQQSLNMSLSQSLTHLLTTCSHVARSGTLSYREPIELKSQSTSSIPPQLPSGMASDPQSAAIHVITSWTGHCWCCRRPHRADRHTDKTASRRSWKCPFPAIHPSISHATAAMTTTMTFTSLSKATAAICRTTCGNQSRCWYVLWKTRKTRKVDLMMQSIRDPKRHPPFL